MPDEAALTPNLPGDLAGDDARQARSQAARIAALTPAERLRLLDRLCRDFTRLASRAQRIG